MVENPLRIGRPFGGHVRVADALSVDEQFVCAEAGDGDHGAGRLLLQFELFAEAGGDAWRACVAAFGNQPPVHQPRIAPASAGDDAGRGDRLVPCDIFLSVEDFHFSQRVAEAVAAGVDFRDGQPDIATCFCFECVDGRIGLRIRHVFRLHVGEHDGVRKVRVVGGFEAVADREEETGRLGLVIVGACRIKLYGVDGPWFFKIDLDPLDGVGRWDEGAVEAVVVGFETGSAVRHDDPLRAVPILRLQQSHAPIGGGAPGGRCFLRAVPYLHFPMAVLFGGKRRPRVGNQGVFFGNDFAGVPYVALIGGELLRRGGDENAIGGLFGP